MKKVRLLTEIALLSAFITVTGAIKIPGLFPGTEFQLSAPIAVAICAAFGFSKYILAGLLSSLCGLILGTQNFLNVFIAMVFRLTVGLVLAFGGTNFFTVTISGPLGSAVARLLLGLFVGKAVWPLVLTAVPGMIYTAIGAWPLAIILKRVRMTAERMIKNAVQR